MRRGKNILLSIFLVGAISFSLYARDSKDLLRSRIDSIITGIKCNLSILVMGAEKNDILYYFKPEEKMIPASITKLITTAAALNKLGISYEFKTVFYTDDNDLSDGVINGNLYLKGYGDPDLTTAELLKLTHLIINKNIKKVTGNLVYDESYLDNMYYALADKYSGDTKKNYWPYITALSVNKNKNSSDPAFECAQIVADELKKNNVELGGIVIAGITPDAAKEICRLTRPLVNVITNMNKISDNQSAITLFKIIGAVHKEPPGSLLNGGEAVIDFMTSIGIARDNYEILEGSGLTRYNYVNGYIFVHLLKYMYTQLNIFEVFYNSLPIAGVDGTLKDRMKNTEAEKNIHAKTGTLNNVSTLAGYAVSRDNELIIFYIAMNGFSGNAKIYRDKQDEICNVICSFSRN
ncbi:MAG: D-alanyl-D-alanine carboxypeptidase/D-alanyl-D-alanine endopeptidase [Ignavibacteria bacterium]